MNFSEVQDIMQYVFTDFRVILCTIFVIAYLHLIVYIAHYRKKPKPLNKKKLQAVKESIKAENQETTDSESESSSEEIVE